MQPQKVLCIHDLSAVGRCSLSVILPTLSACGVQACALPTALLSTHTGGFSIPVKQDTFSFSCAALEHFLAQHLTFDCIYSGYLANPACANLTQIAYRQNPDAFYFVDPVLGDHEKAYSFVTSDLIDAMRALCKKAHYIAPNVTESALLLGITPNANPFSKELAIERMQRLSQTFQTSVILTGIPMNDGTFANGILPINESPKLYRYHALPGAYPGTGDLFASSWLGLFYQQYTPQQSIQKAASFVEQAIYHTKANESRFGVCFESCLHMLYNKKGGHLF